MSNNANSYISVDTDRLKADVNTTRSNMSLITGLISEVYKDVQQLNGMWKGKAHDGYVKAFEEDFDSIKLLIKEIDKLISEVEAKNNKLIKCENMVVSIASALK